MKTWAVIKNNEIINLIVWSGKGHFNYPFPHDELIENTDNSLKKGMIKINDAWVLPEIETEEVQEQ
jgi:hypothetical protein